MYLSSNTSAGPLLIDHSSANLFFVDANILNPFIGKVPLFESRMNQYNTYSDATLQNSSLSWVCLF